MKLKSVGKQASIRLFANVIQAVTFVIVSRFTGSSEIGILSFLLTINAFQVAFFDFGIGKRILLARGHHLLEKLLSQVFRSTLPFIAVQILAIAIMKLFFFNVDNIFFVWSFTIATERILDYFQLSLLSRRQHKLSYLIMIVRRLLPLATIILYLYQFLSRKHILDIYIVATLIFNVFIIITLVLFLRSKKSTDIFINQDSRLTNQKKSLAFLSVLEQYKNLDIILIMFFFGSSSTGEYSLVARLFNPLLLVIASVLTQMVQERHQINLSQIELRKSIFLVLSAAATIVIVCVNSRLLVSFIYGYCTENMFFYFLVFTFAILSYFLSGVFDTQYVINYNNRALVRMQIWIYGCTLLLTIAFFAAGELKIGLCVYSSAYFIKLIMFCLRRKVHDLEARAF